MKKALQALLPLALLGVVLWLVLFRPPKTNLAALSIPPNWKSLDRVQGTMTSGEFQTLLTSVYALPGAWQETLEITAPDYVDVVEDLRKNKYRLRFSQKSKPTQNRYWKAAKELLPLSNSERVLSGLHVALDPGHIGGDFAKMEERWFQLEGGKPVMEGELVLQVAKLLKMRLEKNHGAKVTLVRKNNAPINTSKPEDYLKLARKKRSKEVQVQWLAEKYFYRVAEIRARAEQVNEVIRPDLVVALHLNAEGWGDPAKPTLTDSNHFHLLINGAYMGGELAHDDERFAMVSKISSRVYYEEIALAREMAASFALVTGLPPYQYSADAPAIKLDDAGYIWARNLLANRLYNCPVIYLEPYVMNGREAYGRIQAGDYEGQKLVAGKMRPSLIREYASAVEHGLLQYYRKVRR